MGAGAPGGVRDPCARQSPESPARALVVRKMRVDDDVVVLMVNLNFRLVIFDLE